MKTRVNIRDIAKAAGVSIASRVPEFEKDHLPICRKSVGK